MLTITISARALIIGALLIAASLTAFYAHDALAGDPDSQIQGDVNCDDGVDSTDILDQLYDAAGFEPIQTEPCTDIGDVLPESVGEQGPPGPTGQPGPPGPAGVNIFAVVDEDGTITDGDATHVEHTPGSTYAVTFPQDLTHCAAAVTPGPSAPVASNAVSLLAPLNHHIMIAAFYDSANAPVETSFSIIIVC